MSEDELTTMPQNRNEISSSWKGKQSSSLHQDAQEAFSLGLHVPLQGQRNPPTHHHLKPARRAPVEGAVFWPTFKHWRLWALPACKLPVAPAVLERAESQTLFPSLVYLPHFPPRATSPQLGSR